MVIFFSDIELLLSWFAASSALLYDRDRPRLNYGKNGLEFRMLSLDLAAPASCKRKEKAKQSSQQLRIILQGADVSSASVSLNCETAIGSYGAARKVLHKCGWLPSPPNAQRITFLFSVH